MLLCMQLNFDNTYSVLRSKTLKYKLLLANDDAPANASTPPAQPAPEAHKEEEEEEEEEAAAAGSTVEQAD